MITKNITLLSAALALVLAGCGGGAGDDKKDAKGKTTTAKRDVKTDAKAKRDEKKADAKKPDEKKADDAKEDAPDTAGDTPPPEPAEGELSDDKVVEVANVAKEIAAKPADADAILQTHGMDREKFDAALATIAKDQWKSDLYIAAFAEEAKG
jgi:hypothetical protein